MIVCDDLRESIDPSYVNDLGCKAYPIAHPDHPFGALVIYAMLNSWCGKSVRLVNDEIYEVDYYYYKDITKGLIDSYNFNYRVSLNYTP